MNKDHQVNLVANKDHKDYKDQKDHKVHRDNKANKDNKDHRDQRDNKDLLVIKIKDYPDMVIFMAIVQLITLNNIH